MLALYRCGRQTDALDAYTRTREHLLEQLGLQPGPALRTLQGEVLAQAPSLELEPAVADTSRMPAPIGLPARRLDVLGRDDDARAVIDLLRRPDVRLVTVMGPGGVGKTTLALEVAHRLASEHVDGAAFVNLAALARPGRGRRHRAARARLHAGARQRPRKPRCAGWRAAASS